LIVHHAAVERTVILSEFCFIQVDRIIAPLHRRLVPLDEKIQGALGIISTCIDRGIVAVDRIIGVSVDILHELLFIALRVVAGFDQIFAFDLALQGEGGALFRIETFLIGV